MSCHRSRCRAFRTRHTALLPGILSLLVVLLGIAPPLAAQPLEDYDIYVYNLDLGTITQITKLAGVGAFDPAWSPDATYIVHDVVDPARGRHGLAVTDGAHVTRRVAGAEDDGNNADWHPHGHLIAFDREPAGDLAIYTVPAPFGGRLTLVLEDALDPTWSPDGRYLAFHRPSDGTIRSLDTATGALVVVAEQGTEPAWGPNGYDAIAYAFDGDVYAVTVAPDGTPVAPPVQLTTDPAHDGNPTFVAGRHVVFHTDRAGTFGFWNSPLSGSGVWAELELPGTNEFDPAGSPKGFQFAFAGTEYFNGKSTGSADRPGAGLTAAAYPNPFNPYTTLRFTLTKAGDVRLEVFDVLGRRVALLADGPHTAGPHAVRFDAPGLPTGTYLYRLQAGAEVITQRITLVK